MFDRDMSFLAFNARVLQEAADERNPLLPRLHFLAIFSSNLDEFFRVRVAGLRADLRRTERASASPLQKKLDRILREVDRQQERFGMIFREHLVPAMAAHNWRWRLPEYLSDAELQYIRQHVAPELRKASQFTPIGAEQPMLQNRRLYFYVRMQSLAEGYSEEWLLPYPEGWPRFITLFPSQPGCRFMFLDDVWRVVLDGWFPDHRLEGFYAIKLNRDAALHWEEGATGSLPQRVQHSLPQRETNPPSRFLYDRHMPPQHLGRLRSLLGLQEADLAPGGRYHNWNDLWRTPFPAQKPELHWPAQPEVPYLPFESVSLISKAVDQADHALFTPYHPYDYVIRFLREAAVDPQVQRIDMSIYRLATDSLMGKALLQARAHGKEVVVFVEVKARFDEASNLDWGRQLEDAGAQVYYGLENRKVHAKALLITRLGHDRTHYQALLSTGNFNEQSAGVYSDLVLLTADRQLGSDLARLFRALSQQKDIPRLDAMKSAPWHLRSFWYQQLDALIEAARTGHHVSLKARINALEDPGMVRKLYEASQAGVHLQLLVRGICCAVPGVAGMSERMEIRSYVGRYLEHARCFILEGPQGVSYYASSADWMTRNLDHRIEILFPVRQPNIQQRIRQWFDFQWQDSFKTRKINQKQTNPYITRKRKRAGQDGQTRFYESLLQQEAQ